MTGFRVNLAPRAKNEYLVPRFTPVIPLLVTG